MGVNVITQQPQATVIAINSTHETEINGGGGGGEIPSIVSAKSDVEAPLLGQTHPAARRNSDGDGRVGGRRNTVEPEEGERTCRICFDGVSEGRLISPCKCKGTSKYVHTKCLHQWRTTSQKQESYYECDTCKYKYELSRAKFEAVLTNKCKASIHFSMKLTLFLYFLSISRRHHIYL